LGVRKKGGGPSRKFFDTTGGKNSKNKRKKVPHTWERHDNPRTGTTWDRTKKRGMNTGGDAVEKTKRGKGVRSGRIFTSLREARKATWRTRSFQGVEKGGTNCRYHWGSTWGCFLVWKKTRAFCGQEHQGVRRGKLRGGDQNNGGERENSRNAAQSDRKKKKLGKRQGGGVWWWGPLLRGRSC